MFLEGTRLVYIVTNVLVYTVSFIVLFFVLVELKEKVVT